MQRNIKKYFKTFLYLSRPKHNLKSFFYPELAERSGIQGFENDFLWDMRTF